MKTRITFILTVFLSICFSTTAQVKIFQNNWISLGSLQEGGFGLQIAPNRYSYFRPSVYGEYTWSNLVYTTDEFQKNWIIEKPNTEQPFFVYGNGFIYSRGLLLGSDIKFKENISDIESPLEKIIKLHGVSYNLVKSDTGSAKIDSVLAKDGTWLKVNSSQFEYIDTTVVNKDYLDELIKQRDMKHFGLIAQEVKEVVPELVNIIPDGTYAVEYTAVIGILIEAIKEQQIQINTLTYAPTAPMFSDSNSDLKSTSEQSGVNLLYQNTPNPFNKSTAIRYKIISGTDAVIMIFDMQGSLIKTIFGLSSGDNKVTINSFELKPGMYMYSLVVDGSIVDTKRMILTN
ncbi:MAG: tail fiber domain-containing protein [Bacteroidota bacterium]